MSYRRKKNHTAFTDLNRINFVDLFYSFIFQQSLIKICQSFPNYTVNYLNLYFMHLLHKILSFFWSGCKSILIKIKTFKSMLIFGLIIYSLQLINLTFVNEYRFHHRLLNDRYVVRPDLSWSSEGADIYWDIQRDRYKRNLWLIALMMIKPRV